MYVLVRDCGHVESQAFSSSLTWLVQDMVDAEKAAKSGKKVKKKKKKKKKKGGKKGKKGKKKKDPTSDRALEHLYVEMVSNGILQQPLKVPASPRSPRVLAGTPVMFTAIRRQDS